MLALGLVTFLASAGLYIRTSFAGLPGGDAGELIAEACQLGVAHPPGYPLFTYLAWLAVRGLPAWLGSPAHRVNLACCVAGALAAVLLYRTISRTARLAVAALSRTGSGGSPAHLSMEVSAAFVALWFAFSPDVWLYSVGAEVFGAC